MPIYTCPRCIYSTKIKTHMRNHFNRIVTCSPTAKDINIPECYRVVLGEKDPNISKNYLILPEKSLILPENSLILPENSLILPEKSNNIRKYKKNSGNLTIFNKKNPNKLKRRKQVECPFCNKIYSRKDNLKVHIENSCSEYSFDEIDNRKTNIKSTFDINTSTITNDTIINLKNQLDYEKKLREKDREHIEGLKKQVEMLLDKVGDTYNTNTYNIVIKPFGEENTSYITGDIVRKIIKDGPYSSIPKLLEYIHFNPEHKENHNIKITNKKQPYAHIFNGEKWLLQDKKQTIEDMSDKAFTIINKHYYGANDYMNKFKSEYTEYNLDLNKRLMRDVELSILNSQEKIINN
jgi:hypothetical protein